MLTKMTLTILKVENGNSADKEILWLEAIGDGDLNQSVFGVV